MEKMSWWGNIEGHLYLQSIIFFYKWVILKDTWKKQFFGFIKLKRTIHLWPPQIFLETPLKYIHLKMEMEEFVT